jgi:hypothetical protein
MGMGFQLFRRQGSEDLPFDASSGKKVNKTHISTKNQGVNLLISIWEAKGRRIKF